jgi:hypothetical protein
MARNVRSHYREHRRALAIPAAALHRLHREGGKVVLVLLPV